MLSNDTVELLKSVDEVVESVFNNATTVAPSTGGGFSIWLFVLVAVLFFGGLAAVAYLFLADGGQRQLSNIADYLHLPAPHIRWRQWPIIRRFYERSNRPTVDNTDPLSFHNPLQQEDTSTDGGQRTNPFNDANQHPAANDGSASWNVM